MTETFIDNNEPIIDPNKDYLAELVGENKKYKDPAELAKSKMYADHHIATLEREKQELLEDYKTLRQEFNSRAKIEELLDQMKNMNPPDAAHTPQQPEDRPSFDPEQLKSFFKQSYAEETRAERERANFNQVQAKLREAYGNEYQRQLTQQLNEIGLSDEDAVALAKKSPSAFYRQFGLDKKPEAENFQAPPRSDRRGDSFVPQGAQKRTWSYYQNLKKTNPELYWDPKTQVQKDKDYQTLGKEFEDGDFNR